MDGGSYTRTALTIAFSLYTYFFMRHVLKKTPKDSELTKSEKIQTIILLILNTLFSWLILYFGWKKKLPQKARQVKKYFLWIMGILLGIAVLGIIVAVILLAIHPQ